MLGKSGAQLLGDIGHLGEIGDAAAVNPAPELARTHTQLPFGYADAGELLRDFGAR